MDISVRQYYENPHVYSRMVEFLGANTLEQASCLYLARCDDALGNEGNLKRPTELSYFLENGFDVSRSLWDRNGLMAHLDIEYVNFDFPAEPYLDPLRSFRIQKPIMHSIQRLLRGFGISALHLLSGRGHHFAWHIRRGTPAFGRLAQLGHMAPTLMDYYRRPRMRLGEEIDSEMGSAFAGLGLLMEFIAHRVREEAVPECDIPVELSAVSVSPQLRGREMVSIDITEYGDPLDLRVVRVPFSVYLKPWQKSWILHDGIRSRVPLMFLVPVHRISIEDGIRFMRGDHSTTELAQYARTTIPDQSGATERLIRAYADSDVAQFHEWFYSQEQHAPEKWSQTYDKLKTDTFPPCVTHVLNHPNDLLLQPAGIRLVVRFLMSQGWHPRHIAGLIRSKYERDFNWGRRWYVYNAASRADFYTRVFSGLIQTGRDHLTDYDCASTRDNNFCLEQMCDSSLELSRERLSTAVTA